MNEIEQKIFQGEVDDDSDPDVVDADVIYTFSKAIPLGIQAAHRRNSAGLPVWTVDEMKGNGFDFSWSPPTVRLFFICLFAVIFVILASQFFGS
jgi:hypothetical protein